MLTVTTPFPNRSLHAELNKLIIDRLPLSLPPYATEPSLYLLGLASFANIYLTFERCWHDILLPHNPPPTQPTHADAILSFLSTLLPASLPRTTRLRADLAGKSRFAPRPHHCERRYMAHIAAAVHARPHVLVAYAWVMYMAIFSGGRYIRLQLAAAGEDFWMQARRAGEEEGEEGGVLLGGYADDDATPTTPPPPVYPGFTFLHFEQGTRDGEDLKSVFKERLAAAETLLAPGERADVVAEARRIFKSTIDLVLELDETAAKLVDRRTVATPELEKGMRRPTTTVLDEKAALLWPPTSVRAVHLRFRERRDAARKLAVVLAALLLLYLLGCVVYDRFRMN